MTSNIFRKIANSCHDILYKRNIFIDGRLEGPLCEIIPNAHRIFYIDGRELHHLTMLLRVCVNDRIMDEKY